MRKAICYWIVPLENNIFSMQLFIENCLVATNIKFQFAYLFGFVVLSLFMQPIQYLWYSQVLIYLFT